MADIKRVIKSIGQRPRRDALLVAGNFNTNLAKPGGERPRGRDRSGHCGRWDGGHFRALPPAPPTLGTGQEYVVHAPPRGGGAVPDGLPSGDRHPSIPEHFCPGTPAQLRTFHSYGVPPRRRPMGA